MIRRKWYGIYFFEYGSNINNIFFFKVYVRDLYVFFVLVNGFCIVLIKIIKSLGK